MSQQIVSNLENGTLLISDKFDINASVNAVDATPYFNTVESEYIISFVNFCFFPINICLPALFLINFTEYCKPRF